MDFVKALDIAQGVFDKYKVDQRKWWNRMDGTPILNDVAVRMAQAFIAEQDLPSAALSAEPVHPSLPSPPVSGEADAREIAFHVRHSRGPFSSVMGETYSLSMDFPSREAAKELRLKARNFHLSPLTNEPVGVTTREEWEAAQHALASLEACSFYSALGMTAGSLALTVRKVLNRLPAAKEPPATGEPQ